MFREKKKKHLKAEMSCYDEKEDCNMDWRTKTWNKYGLKIREYNYFNFFFLNQAPQAKVSWAPVNTAIFKEIWVCENPGINFFS